LAKRGRFSGLAFQSNSKTSDNKSYKRKETKKKKTRKQKTENRKQKNRKQKTENRNRNSGVGRRTDDFLDLRRRARQNGRSNVAFGTQNNNLEIVHDEAIFLVRQLILASDAFVD
jgi:hypothetical protein